MREREKPNTHTLFSYHYQCIPIMSPLIDEISMINSNLFEKLDIIAQKVRKNKQTYYCTKSTKK
jgi:hypothetical protein